MTVFTVSLYIVYVIHTIQDMQDAELENNVHCFDDTWVHVCCN